MPWTLLFIFFLITLLFYMTFIFFLKVVGKNKKKMSQKTNFKYWTKW